MKTGAKHLAERISEFDRRSKRNEYTETDEAWELLLEAMRLLRRIGNTSLTVRSK